MYGEQTYAWEGHSSGWPLSMIFLLLLAYLIASFFILFWPFARILKRMGFSPAWALLGLVFPLWLIGAWILAYVRWPNDDNEQS